nr:AprI/Inh family metalloprotease inhibitor [Methylobacterium sp. BTF04]
MRDSLGDWRAVPDDGQPGCRLTLTDTRTIGGWSVEPAATCAARLSRLADAYAWDYERGVRVFDATRKAIMTFEEDETTLMKTRGAATPAVMLVRAKAGVERAPNAAAVAGTWAMRRQG